MPSRHSRLPAVLALLLLILSPAIAQAQQARLVQATANWSGYVASNAYYTGVSALIQAPLPYAYQSLSTVVSWVGIGGYQAHDLIQAGLQEANVGPFVSYQAWYETLPHASRHVVMDIQPGAWVEIDIRELKYDLWQITIVNGASVFQQRMAYPSSHSSAEWVVEEPAVLTGQGLALAPLAAVTGANFAHMSAVANGHPAIPSQLSPAATAIVSPTGLVKAVPTALTSGGASFNVTTVAL